MMPSKSKNTKVVLCGSSSVGKTTILQRILNKEIDNIPSTLGVGFATIYYTYNETKVGLNLWDTAGQEAFRSLVNIYFRDAEIAVLVFDLSNMNSFRAIRGWIDDVQENCGKESPSFILCGNKSDRRNERKVQQHDIDELAKAFKMHYFEVSAYENTGINDLLQKIASLSLQRTSNTIIEERVEPEEGKCC
ncbi:ras family protein [Histomonas meleagridis]|uniref:ras family protein n=1 Tax=Histomonas meleagridis TaxID=135588 RepID=UPI0035593F42|nr:ras family protein [Histomonas meleagridis]KAH0805591.1 ras family protein [Histomonas meleagridis]